jgi:hypothetical protein
MPRLREYKIFISHSWRYSKYLENLHRLLVERKFFNAEFYEVPRDERINSENTSYIKRMLKEKILSSDIVIVIAGMFAAHSKWIAWELETAHNNSIPVIAVIPRGQEKIPRIVTNLANEDVRWNTESIVAAIREWADKTPEAWE